MKKYILKLIDDDIKQREKSIIHLKENILILNGNPNSLQIVINHHERKIALAKKNRKFFENKFLINKK